VNHGEIVLEHDLLEALIALPEQLFYNTGIATYVWVVTNRKAPARRGKVQLIDATSFWTPMRKSLGDKRREIPFERAQEIVKLLADFEDGATRVTRWSAASCPTPGSTSRSATPRTAKSAWSAIGGDRGGHRPDAERRHRFVELVISREFSEPVHFHLTAFR
jgi:type I restriction-modification system DNA methylase subunit